MKIGTDRGAAWQQDIERISAVRKAIGDDADCGTGRSLSPDGTDIPTASRRGDRPRSFACWRHGAAPNA
jgi:hypothetical protein